jgi:hypothetical protein
MLFGDGACRMRRCRVVQQLEPHELIAMASFVPAGLELQMLEAFGVELH